MAKVGRQGVVTMEESKTADDNLVFVEGMQFDRGYYSPYFVTDPERMVAEYENCKVLLVDKKISTARDIISERRSKRASGGDMHDVHVERAGARGARCCKRSWGGCGG